MPKNLRHKSIKFLFFSLSLLLIIYGPFVKAYDYIDAGQIETKSESSENRIAPGEFLPISVKLINFGSLKRVDVIVDYKILNKYNEEVYSENETVAVETTASFIKRIQIPGNIDAGNYTLVSLLTYPYQEQPAVSKFSFTIEKKIGGFFTNDLILYSVIASLFVFAGLVFVYFFTGYSQRHKVVLYDYSDKPKSQIIYYQILGNIISEMRLRIGDDAIDIAKDIPDLQVNEKNGYIIDIKGAPTKIIALLISRYEKISGQRVSFSLRPKN
jgi:hypothetical protein